MNLLGNSLNCIQITFDCLIEISLFELIWAIDFICIRIRAISALASGFVTYLWSNFLARIQPHWAQVNFLACFLPFLLLPSQKYFHWRFLSILHFILQVKVYENLPAWYSVVTVVILAFYFTLLAFNFPIWELNFAHQHSNILLPFEAFYNEDPSTVWRHLFMAPFPKDSA